MFGQLSLTDFAFFLFALLFFYNGTIFQYHNYHYRESRFVNGIKFKEIYNKFSQYENTPYGCYVYSLRESSNKIEFICV